MSDPSVHGPKKRPLGKGGWFIIVALGAMLGFSIWFMFYGWNLTYAKIDTAGIKALVLGVVMSILLGGGLMALVFYSNRKGYDR